MDKEKKDYPKTKIALTIIGILIGACFSWAGYHFAKRSLFETNRPWLTVEAIKFEQNNSYIYAKKSKTEEGKNIITIMYRFKITNSGKSEAKDIKIGDVYFSTTEYFPDLNCYVPISGKAKIHPAGYISLAPGESAPIDILNTTKIIDERAIIDTLQYIKDDKVAIPFNFEIFYSGVDLYPIKEKIGISVEIEPQSVKYNYKTRVSIDSY